MLITAKTIAAISLDVNWTDNNWLEIIATTIVLKLKIAVTVAIFPSRKEARNNATPSVATITAPINKDSNSDETTIDLEYDK